MHQLSDEFLLEAYRRAIKQKLDVQFIALLQAELKRRGLYVEPSRPNLRSPYSASS